MASQPDGSSEILEAVALLVVDMQPSILAAVANNDELLVRCGLAVASARALGIKVLFTEQVPDKLGHVDPSLLALAPGARVFPKETFSALQAPGVSDHLKKLGVYHLLLIGIEAPVCIYQTALHARDSDFDVTVLADCVGGRRTDDNRMAMDSIARSECHVLPGETVFYSMLGTSTHRHFREYTDLVKRFGALESLDESGGLQPPPARKRPSRRRGRGLRADTGVEAVRPMSNAAGHEPSAPTAAAAESAPAEEPADESAPPPAAGRKAIKRPQRLQNSDQQSAETPDAPEDTETAGTADTPRLKKRSRGRRGGRSRRKTGNTSQSSEAPAASDRRD